MRSQLLAVKGVESVEVDYDTKTATVKCAEGTDPKLVAAGLSGTYSGSVQ